MALPAPIIGLTLFTQVAAAQIVTLGPDRDLRDQVEYLLSTWPNQHAIAVFKAVGNPRCNRFPDDTTHHITYCWLTVQPLEFLRSRGAPSERVALRQSFTVHYWYPREDRPPQPIAPPPFEIRDGDQLVALLAPSHFRDQYGATVLAPVSAEILQRLREILKTHEAESPR